MKKFISLGMAMIIFCQLNLPCFALTEESGLDLEHICYNIETNEEYYIEIMDECDTKSSPSYEGDTELVEQVCNELYEFYITNSNNVSAFSIIGEDEREIIGASSFKPYCRICLLKITYEDGTLGYGTGWFYSTDRVATAGHCIYDQDHGWATRIIVEPGHYDGIAPYGTAFATNMITSINWKNNGDDKYDYGLIELDWPLGEHCGYFGYSVTSFPIGKEVTLIGYPGDKDIDFEKWYQWGMTGRILLYSEQKLYYTIDTFSGQSGAPIYINENNVIGIHTNGGELYNSGRRIDDSLFNMMQSF